jgi:hypothetical protein
MGCRDACRYEQTGFKCMYHKGYKRCTACQCNIKTDALRCYCCGLVLRRGAQSNEYRHKRRDTYPRIDV